MNASNLNVALQLVSVAAKSREPGIFKCHHYVLRVSLFAGLTFSAGEIGSLVAIFNPNDSHKLISNAVFLFFVELASRCGAPVRANHLYPSCFVQGRGGGSSCGHLCR